jgi:hypothetical protein
MSSVPLIVLTSPSPLLVATLTKPGMLTGKECILSSCKELSMPRAVSLMYDSFQKCLSLCLD